MRVVTECTWFVFNRVIAVSGPERTFAFIMTAEAKGYLRFFEEGIFVGTVRKMTCPAPLFLERLVHDLLIVSFPVMALVTEFAAFSIQKVVRLGRVRVMTTGASPDPERGMQMGFINP